MREYYQTEGYKDRNRIRSRFRRAGGTWKEYREFETKQKYRCAICKKLYKPGELFFDHCHRTKKKRGLLCRQCNFGVAFFKDSIKLLRRAILYLANSRRKHR